MKAAVGKTIRVGRITALYLALAIALAAMVGVASPATAAKAKDTVFQLGKKNPVKAISTMAGTLADPILRLDNNGTGSALDLQVESSKAPLTVNKEAGTATNLSADEVDGKDSTAFFSGKTYEVSSSGVFTGGGGTLAQVVPPNCDSGDKMISGGARAGNEDDLVGILPQGNVQFAMTVRDNGPGSTITAKGLCADFPPLR
jgi:hypothetical protein